MKYQNQIVTMVPWLAALFFLTFAAFWSFSYILHNLQSKRQPRPPGPWGLPILGHLHMLGNLPHRSLLMLSRKYGPIMQLRLGFVPTVMVSSPQAAKLFLKTHDLNFASRPKILASEYLSYGCKGLVFSDYGAYWRNLRKVCTVHLLSSIKMESFMDLRKQEMMEVIRNLKQSGESGEAVNISTLVGSMIERISCGMIFGSRYKQEFNLKASIDRALLLVGAFNIADYIPFFKPFDLQGLNGKMKDVSKILDGFEEKLIREHEEHNSGKEGCHADFIDVMLSLMKSNNTQEFKLDRTNIKAIILDMLGASIDTTSTTIEWALAELLRHPRVMKLVQEELATVVGIDRMVEESDLVKLAYLDNVIKEIMRLHPALPLLIPRESLEDISVGGYHIPKKSRIIINAWAIGRDPNVWPENPEEFYPERFMNNNVDVRGHDMQLIPFGAGRRRCPGMELGLRTVHFVVAQLMHCFKFELPYGMSCEDVDTEEKFGITMPRANPLLVRPTYCLPTKYI